MAHSIIVSLPLPGTDLAPYLALNAAARAALPEEHDGWGADTPEVDDRPEFNLYFYGGDAAEMWGRLQPVLAASPLLAGGVVTLRFGGAGDGSAENDA